MSAFDPTRYCPNSRYASHLANTPQIVAALKHQAYDDYWRARASDWSNIKAAKLKMDQ